MEENVKAPSQFTAPGKSPSVSWWSCLLALGLVALGPIVLFGPMIARGDVLYWGTPLLQFVPWRAVAFDFVRHGYLPLWNPYSGMGAPLLANHQSALLYPPNWFLAVADAGWGEGVLVLLHLIFAGAGMILLLRRMKLGLLAQVIGGTAYASCSYLVSRAGFFSMNAAAAWLPWLLLAADILASASQSRLSKKSLGPVAALGGVIALQALAGHAQTMAYSLILALAWSIWRSWSLGGSRAGVRLALLWLAGAALGGGLASVQVAPTAEYLFQSSRGTGVEETAALTYSFWPWRTLGLLMPGLFGSPATGDYWGYGNYWEDSLYIGVLPILMAVVGGARAGRLGKDAGRTRTFLLIVAVVAFILGLGSNTPIFPFLFRKFPLFDIFNAPTRINLITTWCLAALAAFGAELWARPTKWALYWTRLGAAGAGAVMLLGLAAAIAPTGLRESLGRGFGIAGLWLLVAGAITLAWPSAVGPRWVVLVALLVTADLVIANSGLNPTSPASLYDGASGLAGQLGRGHRVFIVPEAERILKFYRTHRFDSFQRELDPRLTRESGLPNTLLLDRLPSANNFDPLVSSRYASWIRAVAGLSADRRSLLLPLMDVAWLVADVADEPPWVTYQAVDGPQRARVVPRAVAATDADQALDMVTSDGFDPEMTVVLEDAGEEAHLQGGVGQAEVIEGGNPNQVVVSVTAPEGGWLLLSDLWYPGWVVEVGGEPKEFYAANGAFRAVWVPPGASSVVWSYEPRSVSLGAVASLVSLFWFGGLAGLWIAVRPAAD